MASGDIELEAIFTPEGLAALQRMLAGTPEEPEPEEEREETIKLGPEWSAEERIYRYAERKDNRQLVLDAVRLGHIGGDVLDATYGKGNFWGAGRPLLVDPFRTFTAMDINPRKVPEWTGDGYDARQGDVRRPPFPLGSFDTIVYDPDYKLNGTPDPTEDGPDERYGADVVKTWQERMADLVDGVAWWPECEPCKGTGRTLGMTTAHGPLEALRALEESLAESLYAEMDPGDRSKVAAGLLGDLAGAGFLIAEPRCETCRGSGKGPMAGLAPLLRPGGKLLVKCMDQVSSGAMRWQRYAVMARATAAGLTLVEELNMLTRPRPQPGGRGVKHAASNASHLLIFQAPRHRAQAQRAA